MSQFFGGVLHYLSKIPIFRATSFYRHEIILHSHLEALLLYDNFQQFFPLLENYFICYTPLKTSGRIDMGELPLVICF